MKRNLLQLFLFSLFLFFICQAQAAEEKFTLDPQHTYVQWYANHFGYSHPSGKWMAEGSLTLDKNNPKNSKVNAVIHITDLITGIPKLNEHLLGKLFFNAAEYPTATFVSDKVNVLGKNKAKVQGILTLHGVSKPVTLDVTFNKEGVSPVTDKMTVGFSAKTMLKRSEFGIKTLLPGVGDEVKIDIEAEASR